MRKKRLKGVLREGGKEDGRKEGKRWVSGSTTHCRGTKVFDQSSQPTSSQTPSALVLLVRVEKTTYNEARFP